MKIFSRTIAAGLATVLLLILFANPVYASERSFDISDVDIQARIDAKGNMQVTEQDNYRFHGAFSGVFVLLDSSGSDGIENFQAFEVTPQQEIPLTFEKSVNGSQIQYKVHDQANEETKTFKFHYEIKNVVQMYEDTAELYWKFFDKTNPSSLGTVRIHVELPEGGKKDPILAFGHGPLSGTVEIVGDGEVEYRASPLQAKQMLEVRMLFPVSYVPGSTKIKNTPMLNRIKQEELKWAQEADNARGTDHNKLTRPLAYAIALLAANLAVIVFLYFKYDKERKPDWNGTYYRELPADVTPAVVSYLADYKIEPRDLMATLFDLVRKKHVEIQAVKQAGGLLHKEKTDYMFKLKGEQSDGLKPHEALLIQWFFKQLGRNDEVSLTDIRQYVKKKANARIFALRLAEWKGKVVKEAVQKGYFDLSKRGRNIAVVAAAAQFLPLICFAPGSNTWLAFLAVPLFLYGVKIKRRTKAGATERAKWRAFQRFLHDYSRLESREPMAVHLWEHFFVYAISLGVAKKVIAISNIDLRQADRHGNTLYWTVMDSDLHQRFDHFTESFDKAISTAQSASSRGSGGGFSSGGGGGGGGGGRGAF